MSFPLIVPFGAKQVPFVFRGAEKRAYIKSVIIMRFDS